MLDENLLASLRAALAHVREPIEIVATLGDDPVSAQMRDLLETIAAQRPDAITLRTDGDDARRPSFALQGPGQPARLRFAGLPLGHEFTSLVLALVWAGGHPPRVEPELLERVDALGGGPYAFEVYMSLSCHNCPDVVQALALLALRNPRVSTTVIEGSAFADEVRTRGILAVPQVYLNGEPWVAGRTTLAEILDRLDTGAAARGAAALDAELPFDVLIVGGGPAGAAAGLYAARKGLRTGIVAERFGGQVNDTAAIENYPSVPETIGPKFAAALEQQVRAVGVQVLAGQKAKALEPTGDAAGLHALALESGATLRARTVILATGARWRNLGVPGEAQYRNRGVAYCPHCDGPLFKGRDVAVIGGGNSGVEAAIDLAGLARHVTLLEFAPSLKADAVLVERLRSLPNVTVHTEAQTLEVVGDGAVVTGLRWRDRASGAEHLLPLAGVFVQIGLVPNTEWLEGAVARNAFGEIVVDAKGETSRAGIFAAGDCTTVPYKQIVIAAGEGAKAALAAFDALIRQPVR